MTNLTELQVFQRKVANRHILEILTFTNRPLNWTPFILNGFHDFAFTTIFSKSCYQSIVKQRMTNSIWENPQEIPLDL